MMNIDSKYPVEFSYLTI